MNRRTGGGVVEFAGGREEKACGERSEVGRKGGVDVGGGWVGWWVKVGENRRRSGGVREWARGEACGGKEWRWEGRRGNAIE